MKSRRKNGYQKAEAFADKNAESEAAWIKKAVQFERAVHAALCHAFLMGHQAGVCDGIARERARVKK